MNHTIVHFEIPANDPEKLADFYRNLFGWKIEKAEGEMEYWMVETAPQGQGVNGGLMRRQMPEQAVTNYVLVESVDTYCRHIEELGGKVIVPRQELPQEFGGGCFAICQDPQGNGFGIFEGTIEEEVREPDPEITPF